MTYRVYPIGYSSPGAQERIDELLKQQDNMLIIDTRYSPNSRMSQWAGTALKKRYGEQYHWAGGYLGNINYKGGPILLANPDTGIKGLIEYLSEGYDLILMCQCKVYEDCHISSIVDLLLQKVNVEVVRFEKPGEGMIKAISVCQPYASWLANPQKFLAENLTPKRIENRNWTTNYRGPILIHASKKFEDDAIPGWLSRMPGLKRAVSLEKKDYPLGAIVGRANLVDVITSLENAVAPNPWFCGEYGFKLAKAEPIEPIPYRGALKLFDVTRSVLEQPAQALPEAQTQEPERIIICQRTSKGKGRTMTWAVGDKVTVCIPYSGEVSAVVRETKMEGLSQKVRLKMAVYAPLMDKYIISEDKRWFDSESFKPRNTTIPELGEHNE